MMEERYKLFILLKEYPNLPVMCMADTECLDDTFGYCLQQKLEEVRKTKIWLYLDRVYDSIEDLKEAILDNEDVEQDELQKIIDGLEQHECILCYFTAI